MALKKNEEKQKEAAQQAAADTAASETKDESASTDAPAPATKDESASTDAPAPATKDESASTDAPAPATKDEAADTDTKDDDVKEDQPETPKTANQEKVSRVSRDLQLLKEIKEKHGDKKLVTVANNSKVHLRQPSSGTWIKGKADLRNDGWLHNQVRAGLLKLAED